MRAIVPITVLGLLFGPIALAAPVPALADAAARTLSKDEQRFVSIVRRLEASPLDPALRRDRSWAIQWLVDAPDVTVAVCADMLDGVTKSDFAYSGEILAQYMLGIGAYIVENPDKQDAPNDQQLAGLESALKAYGAMRIADPTERSQAMDDLAGKQSRGELAGHVGQALAKCSAQGSASFD